MKFVYTFIFLMTFSSFAYSEQCMESSSILKDVCRIFKDNPDNRVKILHVNVYKEVFYGCMVVNKQIPTKVKIYTICGNYEDLMTESNVDKLFK